MKLYQRTGISSQMLRPPEIQVNHGDSAESAARSNNTRVARFSTLFQNECACPFFFIVSIRGSDELTGTFQSANRR
jgi:hypothetical protein